MTILEKFLNDRYNQLKHRKTAIIHFIGAEGTSASRKAHTLADLPAVQKDIDETRAAIDGIKQWKELQPK